MGEGDTSFEVYDSLGNLLSTPTNVSVHLGFAPADDDSPRSSVFPDSDDSPPSSISSRSSTPTMPANPTYGQWITIKVKGKDVQVVAMGNDGKDPSTLTDASKRQHTKAQLRPGLDVVEMSETPLPAFIEENRYSRGGKVKVRRWFENVSRTLVAHGMDHVLWVPYVKADSSAGHHHLYRDFGKITKTLKDDLLHALETEYHARQDQVAAGQFLLSALTQETQDEVLAGESSDMLATEILYRLLSTTQLHDINIVNIAKKSLATLRLDKDATLNYSTYIRKSREIVGEMVDKFPDAFAQHHFAAIIAENLYCGDAFHREHVPVAIDDEVKAFYKSAMKTQWSPPSAPKHRSLLISTKSS